MHTSCFARLKKIPPALEPVAISRWVPRWAGKIRRETRLAPTIAMMKGNLDLDEFVRQYRKILADLDPAAVARELGPSAVLVCYEPPGFACHRRLVAEWLEGALGIEVPELGFPRALIPPFDDAPLKGETENLPWGAACDHCQTENTVALGATRCRCANCRKAFPVTWD
ncbi:MAG TPA: hypothetical protein VK395_07630 [Gemmataceae bacterium]|nr:hypothetical protein [Gemmataceae bacterium]